MYPECPRFSSWNKTENWKLQETKFNWLLIFNIIESISKIERVYWMLKWTFISKYVFINFLFSFSLVYGVKS